MEELIKIDTRKDGRRAVSARALHEGLKASERFSNWFERYVTKYGFVDGQDFTSVKSFTLVNNGATREIQDYSLSLDTAKHVCMLQRNELGMKFRQYFIECEKELQKQLPGTYKEALKRLIEEIEEKERLEEQNKKLMHSTKLYTTTEIAKELNMKSAKSLNALLYKMHIQFKQNDTWVPYSDYADKGYTSIKQIILDNGRIAYDRRWTQAGRDFILDQVSKYQEI